MLRTILLFGVAAGLIVAVPMNVLLALDPGRHGAGSSLFTGYTLMIMALSFIFFGVKQYRDKTLGGVIKFVPALLIGLGISAVAGVIYVIGWEISLAATNYAFATDYPKLAVEAARAKGASAVEIEKLSAEMAGFTTSYMNPFFRLPMTFVEIFPVGVLISLITAGLLRNSRFLPARHAAA